MTTTSYFWGVRYLPTKYPTSIENPYLLGTEKYQYVRVRLGLPFVFIIGLS